jgi:tetraacyldisaccharide 4'-kinase
LTRQTTSDEQFRALVSGRRRGPWPELLRGGLWAASVPYGWVVRVRNGWYDLGLSVRRAAVPVVSIGNLTVGGTGKTPCVEYVAQFYQERRQRVAILSRGYASRRGRNDEALLLDENLPGIAHLQGADRVRLADEAVARFRSEVLVLDDGFQHRRLARDLDVVLIDATEPWGYGRVLPRGLLREAPEGLKRASIVLVTRCDLVSAEEIARLRATIEAIAPGMVVAETCHRPLRLVSAGGETAALERLQGRPVVAFCGIGNPDAFRRTLAGLGLEVVAFRDYPDHHAYSPADIEELCAWSARQTRESVVVTTQKDLVKVRHNALASKELWALRIGLHFQAGREMFDRKLGSVSPPLDPGARWQRAG